MVLFLRWGPNPLAQPVGQDGNKTRTPLQEPQSSFKALITLFSLYSSPFTISSLYSSSPYPPFPHQITWRCLHRTGHGAGTGREARGPGLLPTSATGLRVLSRSEWLAPPPEGRGLAFTQGRLRRGKQGRSGAGRGLGWTRLICSPAFTKKLVTPPSSNLSLPSAVCFQSCTM